MWRARRSLGKGWGYSVVVMVLREPHFVVCNFAQVSLQVLFVLNGIRSIVE